VDDDLDVVAVAGERLVDRVVEDLEDHVVQAGAVGRVADVHARALAHRIEALEDLDARRVVVVAVAVLRNAGRVLRLRVRLHRGHRYFRGVAVRVAVGPETRTPTLQSSASACRRLRARPRCASASRRTCSLRGRAS
jgi:hypothetical protein